MRIAEGGAMVARSGSGGKVGTLVLWLAAAGTAAAQCVSLQM
jgi:hypothetical protein